MPTKDHILAEIRRIAAETGKPPGRQAFQKETAIRPAEWCGVYWRTWSDALTEAGYEPNQRQDKFEPEDLLRKYVEATRHFGRIPAQVDVRMYSRERPDFPSESTFGKHFSNKAGLIAALVAFVQQNEEDFADIIPLLPEPEDEAEVEPSNEPGEGMVYLLKSGAHYKIGRSDELERRVKQISVSLPETVTLEHAIRTDDPPGIEAYWHRRFADRRANGEWFKLTVADIRAFKRRKFQ